MSILAKNIGGFLELELGSANFNFHADAMALTSGRSCFNLILQTLKPTKIYVPYYICESALIPLHKHNLAYEFYDLDEELKPKKTFSLKNTEYLLYVNYFGLMNNTLDELYHQYGNRLIIDNTQAFFEKKYHDCLSFNSARKFFGVPDGGFLYGVDKQMTGIERNHTIGYSHLIERLMGKTSAYDAFLLNEANISADILQMSFLSEKLLANIDYAGVSEKRRNNFAVYESAFSRINQFKFNLNIAAVPFCYPLWLTKSIERDNLNKEGVFIPMLWRDPSLRNISGYAFEKQFSSQLLPLPIDHRYTTDDCLRVIDVIRNTLRPATWSQDPLGQEQNQR